MNEFDLQGWERELSAWRRRLERQFPGALMSTLHTLAVELGQLRSADDDDDVARVHIEHRFAELRALYDRIAGGGSSAITPA